MGFALRPGISYCDVSGRLLFLDVLADRYFCLGPDAERAFRTATGLGKPDPGSEAALARLMEAGLLVRQTGNHGPPACRSVSVPTASLLDGLPAQAGAASRLAAAGALVSVRLALRAQYLNAVLSRLQDRKRSLADCGDGTMEAVAEVAAAFEWTARLFRSHDQCLSRSLAVSLRLAVLGLPADFVIGVSLHPFAAHSWVQWGTVLVNDQLDAVRHFTPILVL